MKKQITNLFLIQKGIKERKHTTAKEELNKLLWSRKIKEKCKGIKTKLYHPPLTMQENIQKDKLEHYRE